MLKPNKKYNAIATFAIIFLIVISFYAAAKVLAQDSRWYYPNGAEDGYLPADENPPADEYPPADEEYYAGEYPPTNDYDNYPPGNDEYYAGEFPPADGNYSAVDEYPPIDENPPVDESLPIDEYPPADENLPQIPNIEDNVPVYYYNNVIDNSVVNNDNSVTTIDNSVYTNTVTNTNTYLPQEEYNNIPPEQYAAPAQFFISKTAMNLTAGNAGWSQTVAANPGDTVAFMVTLQAQNDDVHDVLVTDTLQDGLAYSGNAIVSGAPDYSGNDIMAGINIPVIPAGQTVTITYEAQAQDGSYGLSDTSNSVMASTSDAGTVYASATIILNGGSQPGPMPYQPQYYQPQYPPASSAPTGLTNNFFTDSFFLPLSLIAAGMWLYFSGRVRKVGDWLKLRLAQHA